MSIMKVPFVHYKKHLLQLFKGLIEAKTKEELQHFEIHILAGVLFLMIFFAAFFSLYLGVAWQLPTQTIAIYFFSMLFVSFNLYKIHALPFKTRGKVNFISLLLTISLFLTFWCYYVKIRSLIWFILMIITLLSAFNTNSTLINTTSLLYYFFYIILYYVIPTNAIIYDNYYKHTLLVMILLLHVTALITHYYYNFIISKRLLQMQDMRDKNEEINRLYSNLVTAEEELRQQHDELSIYHLESIENQKKLEYLAYYDPLTSLPNRKMLYEQLDLLIGANEETQNTFAVVFIDLDFFKKINDSYGHVMGDHLLIAVTNRLKTALHDKDIIGRLGGDELILIIRRKISEETLLSYIESLSQCFKDQFQVDTIALRITGSFGIAVWPYDGKTAESILHAADVAMYKSKELGRNNIQFYQKGLKKNIMAKIEMEQHLLCAIDYNELSVFYQPLYTAHKILYGFEALLRWDSPKLGQISPNVFIPLAEQTGFIIELGEWVLRQSCEKIKFIAAHYEQDFIISVNVSALQITSEPFIDMVKTVISETQIDVKHLKIELTESVFITHVEQAIEVIKAIREMGIGVALDDFGSGYSSLSYLMDLPIDMLKIDRAFINAIHSKDKWQIVGNIISMAHSLNMSVIAEGVETDAQFDFLIDEKCDVIQGFLFSPPVNGDAMLTHLNKNAIVPSP